jgi:hypothetical protein
MKIDFFENKKTTWGQNWFWEIANTISKDDYLTHNGYGINKPAFVDALQQKGFDAKLENKVIWVTVSGPQVDELIQRHHKI